MAYLVRHAVHALVDAVLVGRLPGVGLSPLGQDQARKLGQRFANEGITAVQSSPRERARQTAEAIAEAARVPVKIVPHLDEIDAGAWTGRSFEALRSDPSWLTWNSDRDTARPPNGESMYELQQRIVTYLQKLSFSRPHARCVLVTHAEVIRAALLHLLGRPLKSFATLEIAPASVSAVQFDNGRTRLISVNEAVRP